MIKKIAVVSLYVIFLLGIGVYPFLNKYINWGELISFIGIIFLGVTALFQEEFKNWWRVPELKIHFELRAPFCSKTPYYIWWKEGGFGNYEIKTEAYYFKLGVTNIGKSQAKLCEVFITELQEYKESRWQEVSYFQTVNLKWAGKSQDAYMNISPSSIKVLSDIGLIIKENIPKKPTDVFWLDYLYRIGGYQPEYLNPNTRYRFKIIVNSENTKPVSQNFELSFTGIWKDSPEEMFKEITIKPI